MPSHGRAQWTAPDMNSGEMVFVNFEPHPLCFACRPERDAELPGGVLADGARPLVLPGPPAAPRDPQQLGLAPRRAGGSTAKGDLEKIYSIGTQYGF